MVKNWLSAAHLLKGLLVSMGQNLCRSVRPPGLLAAALLLTTPLAADVADPPPAAAYEFFEKKVRPLLATHCFECHGAQKQESGLRLDSREAVLRGGDTGPAALPGSVAESLLLEAVEHRGLEMPPLPKKSRTNSTSC